MRLRRMLLASVAGLMASQVSAQESDKSVFLGTLRISSAGAQTLLGNTSVTSEELEDRNASSMADVFDGKSQITSSGGAAIAQKVFVQGIEESLLSVTIDGARQNKSVFHHSGNVLMDPALLKQVGISAGLAPADAGPGGLGGLIAYETADAVDLLEPEDTFGGFLSLTGTNNEQRGTLALFGTAGNFEYLLSGTRTAGEDYVDGDGNTVDGTEADLTDYLVKFAYNWNDGSRLEFAASQTEDTGVRAAQAGPLGLYFARPDFESVTGVDNVFTDAHSRRNSYTLTYTRDAQDSWFDPTFQLSYNEQEADLSGVEGENTSFSGTFKNDFAIGNGKLSAGVDFFYDTAKGQTNADSPYDFHGEETLHNTGVFAQLRQDLGSRVSVSYGARADFQEFEGADGSTFTDSGLSGNASIDILLTDQWSLNAGYATTWGGYELGEAALVNFFTPWTYGGFRTSSSDSARVGLRFENGPWDVQVALFQTNIDDLSAVLPSSGDRAALSNVETRGIDASLGYVWGSGYARLNYTFADVTIDGETAGTTAYYIGRPVGHMIGLESAWDVNDQFRIGGTAEIALENPDTEDESAGTDALPGYEVLNLFAEYVPRKFDNISIRVDISNVFDQTFARRSSDGIGYDAVVALNEPGRTFGLTTRIEF